MPKPFVPFLAASPVFARRAGPVVAGLLLVAWVGGSCLASSPDSPGARVVQWHVAMGSAVLLVWLADMGRRLATRAGSADMPGAASLWRQLMRGALAALWLLVPASGWLALNANGLPAHLLGVVPLPMLFGADVALREAFDSLHAALAWALGVLLLLRTAAALHDAWRPPVNRPSAAVSAAFPAR